MKDRSRWSGRRRSADLAAAAGLLLLTALAGPAAAQDEEYSGRGNTITGHIEVENVGSPSERLEVTVQKITGAGNRRVFSDPTGFFSIGGVFPGNYVVSVRPPLRTDYTEGSAEISIASSPTPTTYVVTIYIRRKTKEVPLIGGGRMISAQESDASVPKEARKAYKQGKEAARAQRVPEAIAAFQRAIQIAPDYLFALNDLGVQYTRLGRYDDAIAVLRRAVAKAPKSFPPHLNLAIALLGAERVQDASGEVTTALGLDPVAIDGLYLSGVVARRLGNADAAIAAFQRAFEQGGADAVYAQYELGQLYEQAGQASAAAKAYRLFLQFVQQGPQADDARQRLRALARA